MEDKRGAVQRAIEGVEYPARRRALIRQARQNRAPNEIINTIHLLAEKEYGDPTDVDVAVVQLARNEAQVWRVLDSPTPPVIDLGENTDYERIVIAWAKRHAAGIDDLLECLDMTGAPIALNLAASIRGDAHKRAIFARAVTNPLSGDPPPPLSLP